VGVRRHVRIVARQHAQQHPRLALAHRLDQKPLVVCLVTREGWCAAECGGEAVPWAKGSKVRPRCTRCQAMGMTLV
jgi:hypothetical protein